MIAVVVLGNGIEDLRVTGSEFTIVQGPEDSHTVPGCPGAFPMRPSGAQEYSADRVETRTCAGSCHPGGWLDT